MNIISPQNRKQVMEFLPCNKLTEFIQCFWYYDNQHQQLPEQLAADAGCDLSICITAQHGQLGYQAVLLGPRSRPMPVSRQESQRYFIGVRFWPGAINVFQQQLAGPQLLDQMIPATLIWHNIAQTLLEPLLAVGNHEQQLQMLESFFLRNFQPRHQQPEVLQNAIKLIRESAGTIKIQQVADDIAISRRQLERKFRSQIGLTPKQFGRITRIRQLMIDLRDTIKPNLLELTAKGKFSDQAHLTRECKALTGTTPQKLIKKIQATEILQYDHNTMMNSYDEQQTITHNKQQAKTPEPISSY
ncbi:helix-turn-helix protein [Sinobacterium caligoides]|uniref:Helix-turn-helix protein n=1 Tax=Sinobacterium caligoides TaxID=933926 RepID=A0A3N2DPZ5_9GAMM|nr:helix-turn-helix domain-containing protein [Sinobacterium caligoides]ROS01867.1 helix-turn-helix protein [Sinobacterium caligoides]